MPRVSIVIPTHNRPKELERTLRNIEAIDSAQIFEYGGAEVLVVDNASHQPTEVPTRLRNGLVVRSFRSSTNLGAAGRNVGAREALGEWLLMLDDDSSPLDGTFARVCDDASEDVGAISARILLPDGSRERGGLPEVVVGCGALVRREAFLDAGGYDEAFGYYAEEYDLCAKLLLSGQRIAYDDRFGVLHRKVTGGRDMNAIMQRITRNSAWVEQRYAPEHLRSAAVERVLHRYEAISEKENALSGYERGVRELHSSLGSQPRSPMADALYDRFTGLAHARAALFDARWLLGGRRIAIVGRGKQAWAVERAIAELESHGDGCDVVASPDDAEALVVGTLSPGPMYDALFAWRERWSDGPVIAPWLPGLPVRSGARSPSGALAA